MSRLELPLVSRKLSTTGDDVVRAELVLEVKTNQGAWEPIRFVVDSGTEMTTMPAAEAKRLKLPIPTRPVPGIALHGQEVRSRLLRARIVGMDASEYTFPCYFLRRERPAQVPRDPQGAHLGGHPCWDRSSHRSS
jgi:hypothetical protein